MLTLDCCGVYDFKTWLLISVCELCHENAIFAIHLKNGFLIISSDEGGENHTSVSQYICLFFFKFWLRFGGLFLWGLKGGGGSWHRSTFKFCWLDIDVTYLIIVFTDTRSLEYAFQEIFIFRVYSNQMKPFRTLWNLFNFIWSLIGCHSGFPHQLVSDWLTQKRL